MGQRYSYKERRKETYEQWHFRMVLYKLRLSTKSEKAIKDYFRSLEKKTRENAQRLAA